MPEVGKIGLGAGEYATGASPPSKKKEKEVAATMAATDFADPRQWLGAERQLKASKEMVIHIDPAEHSPSFVSIGIESMMSDCLLKCDDAPSIYFQYGNPASAPLKGRLPAVAKFKTIDNVVVIGVKQSPVGTYLWGITVADLIAWVPPRRGSDLIKEDLLLTGFKLPHADLEALMRASCSRSPGSCMS